ncbi:MAG: lipocalin-like domain-containing protein [Cyanobacteria bacterium CRU_2_1]|nr:lipocalin-like domain-containing protein [Cyanobacteria bacterium RU_5_0]NJR62944.1 lipocalin-like domain-containing protein [Cyanobacteria bacterium CRU_2_1]
MLSPSSSQKNPLLGIWRLASAIAIHSDGTVEPEIYGANPSGYITYLPSGHMMVMFSRSDRSPLSQEIRSPLSQEIRSIPVKESAEAFYTFNAYAGRYTLKGNTVIHHIEIASIPNRVDTQLTRTFILNGDRITLKTPPTPSDGVLKSFELMWERMETNNGVINTN